MAKKSEPPTKDRHLSVWVTHDQEDIITRAAAADDEEKPSRWLRKLGLKRARELGIVGAERDGVTHGKRGGSK